MDEEIRRRLEYEEQFFGISSLFFSDCFKKLMMDEVDSKITVLMKNLRKKLLHQSKSPDQFDAALEKMGKGLRTEYFNILDRLFPEIHAKISAFVNVPSNILLREDLPVRSGIHGILNEIRQEIEALKSTFTSLLYLKQKLIDELQEADSAILSIEYFIKDKKLDFDVFNLQQLFSKTDTNVINSTC